MMASHSPSGCTGREQNSGFHQLQQVIPMGSGVLFGICGFVHFLFYFGNLFLCLVLVTFTSFFPFSPDSLHLRFV